MVSQARRLGAESTLRRNRSVYREFLSQRTTVLVLAIFAVIVVAFTLSGSPAPGVIGIPPLMRMAYYALCASIGSAVCYSTAAIALYVTRSGTPLKNVVAISGAMLIATVANTAIAHVAQFHLFSVHTDLAGMYRKVLSHTLPIAWIVYYLTYQRTLSSAPATAAGPQEAAQPGGVREPDRGDASADQSRQRAATGSEQQARLFSRLSQEPDGGLVCLKTRGHYLDVFTTTGRHSALMRLADATSDLDALGLRVHRSHWVAHAHVAGLVRHGQSQRLRLSDGSEIPVSRTYLAAVRAAFPSLFDRHRGSAAQDSPAADRPAVSGTGFSA